MKKIILTIICLLLCLPLSSCSAAAPQRESESEATEDLSVRSVWMTYYELQQFTDGKDEQTFREAMRNALQDLAAMGFNTVTVHVRPCADAFYRSAVFPSSQYCFGKQGSDMPYDPLAIICSLAKEASLRVEAWVKPYRVSQQEDITALSADHIARQWYEDEALHDNVYIAENGIYFNPAGEGVEQLIVSGVREIVENYPVDAIHFDDYFYPTQQEEIDSAAYQKYRDNGGDLSLSDFRRETVSRMVKSVYSAVKEANPAVLFGISPAADLAKDYGELYADVTTWMTAEGYVDYIVPQIYFGFLNEVQPFMATTKKWAAVAGCPLYVGLPLYKCGNQDEYASAKNNAAINEFIDNDDIIARQIRYLSKLEQVDGFYLFSYGCLHSEKTAKAVSELLTAMQDSSRP